MHRRILIIACIAVLFAVSGCEQATDTKTDDAPQTLYSGTNSAGDWVIMYNQETADGIVTTNVSYTLTSTDGTKKAGFGIAKQESGDSVVYKGSIMIARTSAEFTNQFYNRYSISLGTDSILMTNAISSPATKNEWYQYLILGTLTGAKVESLKAATVITVSLIDSTGTNATMPLELPSKFQTALLSKM